ncbi:MAG TPA: hypothetical protein VNX88_11280 [Terriglobales bacterium]|nr:hypothetical protein [Terriglobales bacterium]
MPPVYYREEVLKDWRKGVIRWEELSPMIQKYIIDHGILHRQKSLDPLLSAQWQFPPS